MDGWTGDVAFLPHHLQALESSSEEAMTGQGESLTTRALPGVYPPRGVKESNGEIRKSHRNKNNKVPFPFHLNWLSVILHKFNFKPLLCNVWKIVLNETDPRLGNDSSHLATYGGSEPL